MKITRPAPRVGTYTLAHATALLHAPRYPDRTSFRVVRASVEFRAWPTRRDMLLAGAAPWSASRVRASLSGRGPLASFRSTPARDVEVGSLLRLRLDGEEGALGMVRSRCNSGELVRLRVVRVELRDDGVRDVVDEVLHARSDDELDVVATRGATPPVAAARRLLRLVVGAEGVLDGVLDPTGRHRLVHRRACDGSVLAEEADREHERASSRGSLEMRLVQVLRVRSPEMLRLALEAAS
jgi:hypothetical protein